MSRLPPVAVLLAALAALTGVVVVEAPLYILALGTPPLLALLANETGRRAFGRRLFVTTPLIGVAVVSRWGTHAEAGWVLAPALRIVSAVAWSSWLSALLQPREMWEALRALGAPPALLELIVHTRRFALQLATTAGEAWSAAALRGGLLSLSATGRTVGQVAGVTVVRAFDRAECVAIARALRGASFDDALPEARPVVPPLHGQTPKEHPLAGMPEQLK